MHIFQRNIPLERTRFDIGLDIAQTLLYISQFVLSKHTDRMQHYGMRKRPLYILSIQSLIKRNRLGEQFNQFICALAKAATPKFFTHTENVVCSAQTRAAILKHLPAFVRK